VPLITNGHLVGTVRGSVALSLQCALAASLKHYKVETVGTSSTQV
jgi:hypothetical protein